VEKAVDPHTSRKFQAAQGFDPPLKLQVCSLLYRIRHSEVAKAINLAWRIFLTP
jgi:hypothetical protein